MQQTNEEVLIGFITANPQSTKTNISEGTDLKGLVLFNILKKLGKEGSITVDGSGTDATYSISKKDGGEEQVIKDENNGQNDDGQSDSKNEEEEDNDDEETTDEENEEQPKDKNATIKFTTRDNSKFKFNGEEYGKGPLVRAVVAKYVEDHQDISFEQLKAVFPDVLLKRFGIFQDETTAREISGKRDRYFLKETQMIKLQDKNLAVSSQFTAENVQPFLKVAKELGYKIK